MKDDIVSSVREEIETKMDEYFNEIIWKEEKHRISDQRVSSPCCRGLETTIKSDPCLLESGRYWLSRS